MLVSVQHKTPPNLENAFERALRLLPTLQAQSNMRYMPGHQPSTSEPRNSLEDGLSAFPPVSHSDTVFLKYDVEDPAVESLDAVRSDDDGMEGQLRLRKPVVIARSPQSMKAVLSDEV